MDTDEVIDKQNNDVPFEIGTIIYENESLEANVVKQSYKVNKVFCLEDHLFVAR